MVRIARNLALDHLKRAESRLTSSMDENFIANLHAQASQADVTFNKVASDEEFSQFCAAVRHLPLQCRRVFVLKKVYGFSQREIAAELKLSESTVEKHISKGMKLCTRQILQHSTHEHFAAPALRRASTSSGIRA